MYCWLLRLLLSLRPRWPEKRIRGEGWIEVVDRLLLLLLDHWLTRTFGGDPFYSCFVTRRTWFIDRFRSDVERQKKNDRLTTLEFGRRKRMGKKTRVEMLSYTSPCLSLFSFFLLSFFLSSFQNGMGDRWVEMMMSRGEGRRGDYGWKEEIRCSGRAGAGDG